MYQGLRQDMKFFHLPINKVSAAQLVEHLIAEQKVLGLNLGQGGNKPNGEVQQEQELK